MAVSEFGGLMRKFYIAKIRTWENYGGKRVCGLWRGDITNISLYGVYLLVLIIALNLPRCYLDFYINILVKFDQYYLNIS